MKIERHILIYTSSSKFLQFFFSLLLLSHSRWGLSQPVFFVHSPLSYSHLSYLCYFSHRASIGSLAFLSVYLLLSSCRRLSLLRGRGSCWAHRTNKTEAQFIFLTVHMGAGIYSTLVRWTLHSFTKKFKKNGIDATCEI